MDGEDEVEMELRIILATEGERVTDNNLEEKENFSKLFVSEKMEFLDKGGARNQWDQLMVGCLVANGSLI